MTPEGYEAFAPHNNTWENPNDGDTGRRVDVSVAMDLARNGLRRYGENRAQMGLFNNTPIINRLRKAERGLKRTSNIRWEDIAEESYASHRLGTGWATDWSNAPGGGPSSGFLGTWLRGHDTEDCDNIYVN